MNSNIARIKAIENSNKKKLLSINNSLNDNSGIYFLTREDETGIKYAYIGQAKHILTRLSQHMVGYQHIDLSIKKHGWYSTENPYGWKVNALNFLISQLDEKEKYYIQLYANNGFQLRNKTAGGQGDGKVQIDEYRPTKTYRDGLIQGKRNSSRDIAHLFEKHLNVSTKSDPPNVNQKKALDKFNDFLNFHKGGE